MREYLAIFANTYSPVSKVCRILQWVFLKIMKPWAHLPFSPSGLAERLASHWSALIPEDEKLLLALLHWSRLFSVIATSMHQQATACGGENCRYKPCRNEERCWGCWVCRMMDSRLISIWDDWVTKKNVSNVFRKCLFVWPDWGWCDRKMWGFKYTPTRAKAGAHPATRTDKNVWKCLFGCQLVEILLPRVNHGWHEMWETLKNVRSRGVCY